MIRVISLTMLILYASFVFVSNEITLIQEWSTEQSGITYNSVTAQCRKLLAHTITCEAQDPVVDWNQVRFGLDSLLIDENLLTWSHR